jgi:hypothetical protein
VFHLYAIIDKYGETCSAHLMQVNREGGLVHGRLPQKDPKQYGHMVNINWFQFSYEPWQVQLTDSIDATRVKIASVRPITALSHGMKEPT